MAKIPGIFVYHNPEIPDLQVTWPEIFFFRVIGGDLCLIGLKEPKSLVFDVLALETNYSRWNVKYCLDLSALATLYPSMVLEMTGDPSRDWLRCEFLMLSCCVNETRNQTELLISVPGKILSFDMNNMVVKEITDFVVGSTCEKCADLSRYR
ncbi:OLC1v1035886C1 [Oldenlandia corymbosa var. corymbosa]|uniref:OLC1v1035886C1 n=1 Tax=Oldenlandia corymbosa var. corymbosa TaxID=529605 RepID=A0AAV1CU40_OLDCO|nr:OLC1v1035886C1 [Oldenlandia corymbosa var. corymbosa]